MQTESSCGRPLTMMKRRIFLVASKEQSASEDDKTVPVNLLTVAVPIQYIVNDFESWTYKHSEPAKLLESISNREVVRYLVA